MADSIESFVEKLQTEGVEAGKAAAQKGAEQGRAEAEKVLADARQQAERIVADAKSQAERAAQQGRDQLELAARDVFGKLRQTLVDAVGELLKRAAAEPLADEGFLAGLLHDIAVEYAQNDAKGVWPIEIRINEDQAERVIGLAVKALADPGDGQTDRLSFQSALKSAWFEYAVSDGIVEVTPESVAGALSEMIAPRLRELIDRAAAGKND